MIDVGIGFSLSYGMNKNQNRKRVWPTIYRNNQFEPINWKEPGSTYMFEPPEYNDRLIEVENGF